VKQDGEIKLIRDFLKITVLTYTTKDSGYQAKCIGAFNKNLFIFLRPSNGLLQARKLYWSWNHRLIGIKVTSNEPTEKHVIGIEL